MNRFMISVFFISSLLISGCSTSGNQHLKKETSQSLQSKIIKNKTTKSEIITAFGQPETNIHDSCQQTFSTSPFLSHNS